jgi:hypothetical protein
MHNLQLGSQTNLEWAWMKVIHAGVYYCSAEASVCVSLKRELSCTINSLFQRHSLAWFIILCLQKHRFNYSSSCYMGVKLGVSHYYRYRFCYCRSRLTRMSSGLWLHIDIRGDKLIRRIGGTKMKEQGCLRTGRWVRAIKLGRKLKKQE